MASSSAAPSDARRRPGLSLLAVTALGAALLTLAAGRLVWEQREERLARGEALVSMHTRLAEDQLTTSLQLLELGLDSLAPRVAAEAAPARQNTQLRNALAHAPMLRSLSVVSPQGMIVASSNPANLGMRPDPQGLVSTVATSGDAFRIGIPWSGRDFADGAPIQARDSGRTDRPIHMEFLPALYTPGGSTSDGVTLLAAINPDYFINQFLLNLEGVQGMVRVLRYDNRLLFSTRETDDALLGQRLPGALFISRLRDSESGSGVQLLEDEGPCLAAFRASKRYPVVVMAQAPQAVLLEGWLAETRRLLLLGIPALLGLLVLAALFDRERRRRHAAAAHDDAREQRRLGAVLAALPMGAALLGRQGQVLQGNAAWRPEPALDEAALRALLDEGTPIDLETPAGPDAEANSLAWLRLQATPVTLPAADGPAPCSAVAVQSDIAARKLATEQLQLHAHIFDHSSEGIFVCNADNEILWANRALLELTGYSAAEILGQNPAMFGAGTHDGGFYAQMWRDLAHTGLWQGEIANRRKNGDLLPGWLTIVAIKDEGGAVARYVALFSDITEHKASEARIRFLSEHDFLTGLPNRTLFADRLGQAISRAGRHGQRLAVLHIDLDRFKAVNDSLGHGAGDRLLQETAQRICTCVRSSDTVCRQGGDEFLILLEEVGDADAAARVAVHLIQAISRSCAIDGQQVIVTPSIGIAMYPEDGATVETLVSCADMAMYYSKGRGRNAFHFFAPAMTAQATERLAIECGLRGALDKNEFTLHYQPQVSLGDGAIVGVEALIRWNDPQRGLRSPNEFIALAEETGLIVPIGDWVLHEVCRQARRWRDQGLAPIPVAVNVAAPQFYRPGFAASVGAILAAHDLPGDAIELEVTERLILETRDEQLELLQELRRLGVKLSIDDFGSGYSSLAYLHRLPIDKLKIDHAFIANLDNQGSDATITETIIHLAHDLGLTVLAEGVEREVQRDFLRDRGCDAYQGYLFSPPLDGDKLADLLRRQAGGIGTAHAA
ncbi:EAL domain-containing protein [Oryzomicrobium sp.]|uniref:bifunctional diguanylate cyclase/phosphodiesterase n=1 Tax=Oryzomicrobium sp. TaxID=1911578 RepID=UPI0025E0482C|nr:EAL domain-containing protein [Oryzomicrobium sp.]